MDIQKLTIPLSDISASNWMFAAAAALVAYVVMHGAVILFRRQLAKITEDGRPDRLAAEMLRATLARTSNIAVVLTALLIGLTVLDLPPPWDERVRHLWFIALGAQLALYLDRAISVGAQRYFRAHSRDPAVPSTVAHTLMTWAIKTVLWVVFLLAVLSNLGINVTTLIASLGIGGIAVALAAQNILGDLFASLAIAMDKPFEVGDSISVNGMSGSVEHVGLKTTRIRADSGEQIVIGNAELLKHTLRNFKRMTNRRVQFALKIDPGTSAKLAARIPNVLRGIIEQQKGVRFDRAHLKVVGQDALEFDIVFHVLDPAYSKYMDAQQAILLATMEAFDDMGVSTVGAAQHVLIERIAAAAPDVVGPRKPALHSLPGSRGQPA